MTFFPPADWEAALKTSNTKEHNQTRIERLSWLGSVRSAELVAINPNFDLEDDRRNVKELWIWFEKHPHRAAQLAFQISKLVITRDVKKELSQFIRAFSTLSLTSKNEFENYSSGREARS